MLLACLSSSAFAAERNNPIDPWTYQSLLGRGIDVDWCKTRQGMETNDRQIVENFRDMGLSHVRIRVKDDAGVVIEAFGAGGTHFERRNLLPKLKKLTDHGVSIAVCSQCLYEKSDLSLYEVGRKLLDCGVIPVLAYQADDMKNQPTQKNIDRVADWWQTVAERYRDKSYRLSFDLVIEVTNALNDKPELLNDIYEQLVSVVRKSNHDRILMISPRLRSDSAYLSDLEIPSDANGYLMAEWHFYAAGPSKTNEKKLWTTGTPAERQLVQSKIDKALQWQRETGIPTWVGAWMPGNYNDGNDYTLDEQLAFASFVAQALEDASIPFAVNSDTKFYDRVEKRWYSEMLPLTMELFQPESLPFSDVPEGAWYYDSLLYVYQNGIFSGTSATTFSPYQNMTRQQLWTVLGRMAGEKLSGSGVYSAARSWAIRAGVSDGSDPTGTLSRQQLVMLLWRFAGEPTSVQDLSGFSDAAQVSSYAKKAMSWAVENQILTGSGGCLLPHGTATRAQVAAILSRFSIGS